MDVWVDSHVGLWMDGEMNEKRVRGEIGGVTSTHGLWRSCCCCCR